MADSRLADIYRKELKTKGLLGALVSASGARLKEKTDIRGLLPQTGVSGAAFEKMFGKRYKYGGDKQDVRSAGGSDGAATKSMEEKLTRIGVDMKIMAKNSVVLPAMARDMNLMRMNMQKMVKLSGGTPSTKSDMFFKRASDREAQYEGQYKKSSGGLTPTPAGEKKEGGGFLETLLGMSFGGIITSLISGLLKGGLLLTILNGIGKYFTDDKFKETVNKAFDSFFTTVFGEDYKKQLATGAAILVGAVVAMKIAMASLEAAMFAAARRIAMLGGGPGVPGSPNKTNKGGKGGWLKTLGKGALAVGGVALLTEGVKYYLQQGESEEDARRLAQEDIDNQTRETLSPGEEIAPRRPEGMRGSEIADRAGSAVNSAIVLGTGVSMFPSKTSPLPSSTPSSAASGKPLTSFGSVGANREMEKNKTLWEKIAKVMKKAYEKGASKIMLSKLGAKFGTWMAIKLATIAAGVVAAPFSVGASLLISAIGVGMLAKDVYDLYEWFIEYEKELDAFEKSSSPTPVAADGSTSSISPSPSTSSTQAGSMSSYVSRAPNSGGQSSGSYAERIGGRESGGNYDTIFGKSGGAMINGKLVTQNTIGEVGAWQADQRAKKTNKQAAGKYQFMDVISAAKLAGLGPNDLFNGPNQEKMMQAYTDANAKSLRALGLPDTDEYLSMAHAVGPAGAKKLIDAQASGKGGANSLDVLGLQGASAKTNPQLNTSVDATIASLKGGGPMGHGTVLATNNTPTGSTLAFSQASLMEQQYKLMGGGTTVINAPTNNSVTGGSGGSSGNSVSPYNGDLMRYLLRPIA